MNLQTGKYVSIDLTIHRKQYFFLKTIFNISLWKQIAVWDLIAEMIFSFYRKSLNYFFLQFFFFRIIFHICEEEIFNRISSHYNSFRLYIYEMYGCVCCAFLSIAQFKEHESQLIIEIYNNKRYICVDEHKLMQTYKHTWLWLRNISMGSIRYFIRNLFQSIRSRSRLATAHATARGEWCRPNKIQENILF